MTEQQIKEKIRNICTYHSEFAEGTSGYNLSEEQFQELFTLFISGTNQAYAEGLMERKAYVGKIKRKAYQKGYQEAKLEQASRNLEKEIIKHKDVFERLAKK